MPEMIVLKHSKCADTECSVNSFGATVVSWKVDGAENIFVSSLAKTDGTKASKELLLRPPSSSVRWNNSETLLVSLLTISALGDKMKCTVRFGR